MTVLIWHPAHKFVLHTHQASTVQHASTTNRSQISKTKVPGAKTVRRDTSQARPRIALRAESRAAADESTQRPIPFWKVQTELRTPVCGCPSEARAAPIDRASKVPTPLAPKKTSCKDRTVSVHDARAWPDSRAACASENDG